MCIGWMNYGLHTEEKKYQRNVDWKPKSDEKTKREGPNGEHHSNNGAVKRRGTEKTLEEIKTRLRSAAL